MGLLPSAAYSGFASRSLTSASAKEPTCSSEDISYKWVAHGRRHLAVSPHPSRIAPVSTRAQTKPGANPEHARPASHRMERQFLAGAGAGAITKTSVAPMERLKVIFQTSGMVRALLSTLPAVVLCLHCGAATALPTPCSAA